AVSRVRAAETRSVSGAHSLSRTSSAPWPGSRLALVRVEPLASDPSLPRTEAMPAIHNRSRLRFGATPLRRAVTALAIAAAVLLPGCRKCELDPEMASDVGPTARNCGALTLNAGADQLSVAESCAVQAEAENAPFTLASDVRGVDSH